MFPSFCASTAFALFPLPSLSHYILSLSFFGQCCSVTCPHALEPGTKVELSSSAKAIVFLPPKEVPSSLWVAAVQILLRFVWFSSSSFIKNKKTKRKKLSKESGGPNNNFDLPEEVLEVLLPDPFEQLDVACKITSIALSTRVSSLESEASVLRHKLISKDAIIADFQSQLQSLDASLSDASDKLTLADQENEKLLKENEMLSNTVKKLNRGVAKASGSI
ncbi:unnamed protein product [Coffea canephora]|uniref:Uncharacterized protein n=1 Tax=Coffea canephora TaxID=49390 RepID=A0A068UJA6_COFCA|nr:unnamed protein product [Coffea canephora]